MFLCRAKRHKAITGVLVEMVGMVGMGVLVIFAAEVNEI